MTAFTKKRRRGALALAGMLVLGAVGIGGTAGAEAIDTSQTGSIIIHKYENPGNGSQNPGGTGTDPTTDPVPGVVFEYCEIDGIDILDGSNAGWDAINAITPAQLAAAGNPAATTLAGHPLVNCDTVTTGADGTVATPDLPLGPYFVREIDAPPNVVDRAVPFIVTLPTPADHTDFDGEWVYDVNVYPKNTVAQGPVKNIVDQPDNGAALGAPITFQVTTVIPALAIGQTYQKFVLTDTLDAKLDPDTDLSKVSVTAGATTFVPGTDYTPVWNGQTLTVTFTSAGLAKLAAGQVVVVEFVASANEAGVIDNQAFVNLNDFTLTPGQPNGPGGSPTNTASTRWGSVTLRKRNSANPADGLEGAVFRIYMGTTDQAGCLADFDDLEPVTEPNSTDPLEVTSDASGTISIAGLWIGDTQLVVNPDGTVTNVSEPGHDVTQRCYVLQEVKAPSGFVLPTGTDALTEIVISPGANGTLDGIVLPGFDIENDQQVAPQLPLTGASGIFTLTGIGLLAIAIGGGMVISRRRNQAAA